ncbi:Dedicator Of Cytokinesis Protein 1 [Manis pentadactyla]|nr:Dedicator Of Cytokinesis Protein 1 [Manis pentadactyla]
MKMANDTDPSFLRVCLLTEPKELSESLWEAQINHPLPQLRPQRSYCSPQRISCGQPAPSRPDGRLFSQAPPAAFGGAKPS